MTHSYGLPALDVPMRTDHLEESLAKLAFLVERGRPLGVLLSSAGLGKSICLDLLAHEIRETHHAVVKVSVAGMSAETMISAIAAGLGLGRGAASLSLRVNLLLEYLQGISMSKESVAILLDDFELASDECVLALRTLLQRLAQLKANVSFIVSATEAGNDGLRDLLAQADFVVKLSPWTASESARYALGVIERLPIQSRGSGSMIDDSGLRALHECSRGIPARLTRILDLSLLVCEEMEQLRLTDSIVRAATEELFPLEPEPFTLSRRIARPTGV